MKAEVHLVRRCGIKIPAKEAAGVPPLVGFLHLDQTWVTKSRTLPALILTAVGVTNATGRLAILYEPRIVMLGNSWMRFTGFEMLRQGEEKQLVVQDWRCYLSR